MTNSATQKLRGFMGEPRRMGRESMRPVMFIHIPKTAGSYVNAVIAESIGNENVITQFTEKSIDINEEFRAGRLFISGHCDLHTCQAVLKENKEDIMYVASLRDPIEQVASHFSWFDQYGDPEMPEYFYNALPRELRDEVKKLRSVDFTDYKSVEAYVYNISAKGREIFDNTQARYLSKSSEKFSSSVTIEDVYRIPNMLDLILLPETLDRDLEYLCGMFGFKKVSVAPQNVSTSNRKLDLTDARMVAVLKNLVKYDEVLIDRVRAARLP